MGPARTGAAAQGTPRPANYFDQSRPEVAALVPPACRRVLEIGCGEGRLGESLRPRGHEVVGLELEPAVAARAASRLDAIVAADAEAGLPFARHSFDAVLLADVLEHLLDPWRVLREAAGLLRPGGVVVASIPNVQNLDVVSRLARGRWDYRERGILDAGHLRFFTLQSIRELFEQAGLRITQVGRRYRRNWWRSALCLVTGGKARAFLTRQYLVVARKPS